LDAAYLIEGIVQNNIYWCSWIWNCMHAVSVVCSECMQNHGIHGFWRYHKFLYYI